jgi:nucleotide-binding universal stress UspA family protein
VEVGVPYRTILTTIEDEDADLLVMNIHSKGMLDRALLGSTAEHIVRTASCPAMMIPPIQTKLRRKAFAENRMAFVSSAQSKVS